MKLVGIKPLSFIPKDSDTPIEGVNLYLTEPLHGQGCKGVKVEKIFLSKAKLARLEFVPAIGIDVGISWNRFGKPDTLYLENGDDDLVVE